MALYPEEQEEEEKIDSWFLTPSQPWRLYQGEKEEEEEAAWLNI